MIYRNRLTLCSILIMMWRITIITLIGVMIEILTCPKNDNDSNDCEQRRYWFCDWCCVSGFVFRLSNVRNAIIILVASIRARETLVNAVAIFKFFEFRRKRQRYKTRSENDSSKFIIIALSDLAKKIRHSNYYPRTKVTS